MESLTKNEFRAIDFLIRNFSEKHNINGLGRKLGISPRGIYKILKKLEKTRVITPEKIGNAIYYKANLNEQIGIKLAEFVLVQGESNTYSKVMADDLKPLDQISQSCALFGSVLKKGKEAKDIDILLVIKKEKFKEAHKILNDIKQLKPKIIHDIIMTKEDLINNIIKKDSFTLGVIKTCNILWGAEIFVEAIKNGAY